MADRNHATSGALSDREFAQQYGLNPGTPAVWRTRNKGPKFIKLGRAVRYRIADIEQWIEEQSGEEASNHG